MRVSRPPSAAGSRPASSAGSRASSRSLSAGGGAKAATPGAIAEALEDLYEEDVAKKLAGASAVAGMVARSPENLQPLAEHATLLGALSRNRVSSGKISFTSLGFISSMTAKR